MATLPAMTHHGRSFCSNVTSLPRYSSSVRLRSSWVFLPSDAALRRRCHLIIEIQYSHIGYYIKFCPSIAAQYEIIIKFTLLIYCHAKYFLNFCFPPRLCAAKQKERIYSAPTLLFTSRIRLFLIGQPGKIVHTGVKGKRYFSALFKC